MKRFVMVVGIVIAVLAVGVVVGLHRSEAEPSVTLDATRCVRNQRTILTAQTVPGAVLVPCLTDDAAGWTVTAQSFTNDGTTMSYRNDTVLDATWDMEFTATCAPQDGTTVKDGQVDGVPTTGYAVEPATQADGESELAEVAWTRFPGGCVKTTVTVPDTVDRRLIIAESDDLLVLIPRRLLDDDVTGSNDGRIPL